MEQQLMPIELLYTVMGFNQKRMTGEITPLMDMDGPR
jgi:hypothetical protein